MAFSTLFARRDCGGRQTLNTSCSRAQGIRSAKDAEGNVYIPQRRTAAKRGSSSTARSKRPRGMLTWHGWAAPFVDETRKNRPGHKTWKKPHQRT